MADPTPKALQISGYVLRRTEEPDRQGDVIDLDQLSLPHDPVALTDNFGPVAVGMIDDLVLETDGLRVTARVIGEMAERLRHSACPGFAFAVGIRNPVWQGNRVVGGDLTHVALVPREEAVSRGTEVRMEEDKPDG